MINQSRVPRCIHRPRGEVLQVVVDRSLVVKYVSVRSLFQYRLRDNETVMGSVDDITAPNVALSALDQRVDDFLSFVRDNSPFYGEFWLSKVSSSSLGLDSLESYPLTDHAAYWQANTCLDSRVVTSKQQDGIVFKTGGTQFVLVSL